MLSFARAASRPLRRGPVGPGRFLLHPEKPLLVAAGAATRPDCAARRRVRFWLWRGRRHGQYFFSGSSVFHRVEVRIGSADLRERPRGLFPSLGIIQFDQQFSLFDVVALFYQDFLHGRADRRVRLEILYGSILPLVEMTLRMLPRCTLAVRTGSHHLAT